MKKILLVIICLAFLTACQNSNSDSSLRVIPPDIKELPLKGTWEVVSLLGDDMVEPDDSLIGENIYFTDDYVLINEYFLQNPRYSIRRVESASYLVYHHQAYPTGFSFKEPTIEILTLYEGDQYFCEFVKESDEELLLIFLNKTYLLKQVSDDVDETILKYAQHDWIPLDGDEDNYNIPTGILLGLRTPQADSSSYRTLWISFKDDSLSPILEVDKIFFPRRSGFYQLEVEHENNQDILLVKNVLLQETQVEEDNIMSNKEYSTASINRSVNYIGNDYISLEETIKQESIERSRLKVVAVDSLPILKPIKISDLAGPDAASAMEQQRERLLKQLGIEQIMHDEENFGLARKMGYWIFTGRLEYKYDDEYVTNDYNISAILPNHVVYYNELKIPWTRIKNHVPAACDVFTSPNSNLALVITDDEIIVYKSYRENLIDPPLEKIPLKDSEKVIMAEWAVGDYVENWEMNFTEFISN
ncbi:MAG: hypothetical protein GX076_04185 [Clostridiales bacterium]|nr:hypothetical protein [Clostridiales bacterium]